MSPLAWIPLAQAAPPSGGSPWQSLLLMGAIFVGMYALLIYPQRKQQKAHEQMLSEIERGDQVVFAGGIHGKVVAVDQDLLTLEIADRVRVKVNRAAVGARTPQAAAASQRPKEKRA